MSEIDNTERLDDLKETLFDLVDDFRENFDLDFEEMDIEDVKEWLKPLLLAGVGAFLLYKLLSIVVGSRSDSNSSDNVLNSFSSKRSSTVNRFFKEQFATIVLALFRRWVKSKFKG